MLEFHVSLVCMIPQQFVEQIESGCCTWDAEYKVEVLEP